MSDVLTEAEVLEIEEGCRAVGMPETHEAMRVLASHRAVSARLAAKDKAAEEIHALLTTVQEQRRATEASLDKQRQRADTAEAQLAAVTEGRDAARREVDTVMVGVKANFKRAEQAEAQAARLGKALEQLIEAGEVKVPALPEPPEDAESNADYTDWLTGARKFSQARPYPGRNRQCSIGYHDECSDPEGARCECPCHAIARVLPGVRAALQGDAEAGEGGAVAGD